MLAWLPPSKRIAVGVGVWLMKKPTWNPVEEPVAASLVAFLRLMTVTAPGTGAASGLPQFSQLRASALSVPAWPACRTAQFTNEEHQGISSVRAWRVVVAWYSR